MREKFLFDCLRWGNADGFILEPVEGEMLASMLRSVMQACSVQ